MVFFTLVSGIALAISLPSSLRADTQGANSPSTAVNDTGIGSVAWTGPGNVTGSEDTRATVTMSSQSTPSNYIKATGFGFSIPTGSTINGIIAEVEHSEGNTNGQNGCVDNAARIVKGGTISSTDRSSATAWPTSDAYDSHGSSSDLWGESWTVSDINSATFGFAISAANTRSGGNPGNTEVCRVDHVRITVHYTLPPTTYDQSAYRWFNNANSTDVGSALANQDTVATVPVKDTPFRLRMALHVGTTNLAQSGGTFKLQFAKKGGGSCASPGDAYADVTTSSAIQYYDNASASDGTALTTNANDPQHSTHTTRAQTYEEANTFTNSQAAIAIGEDGMWDFALVDDSADYGAAYCFKAVLSGGSDLDSYGVYPEITTAIAPTVDQSAYRWFEHQGATREFGTSGVVTGASASFFARAVAIDDSYMYVAGDDDSQDWRIEKRALSNGAVDSGFGTSGAVTGAGPSLVARGIAIDSTYMYVVGTDVNGDWRIEKRALSNGAVDSGFGTSGVVTGATAGNTAFSVAIDGSYMYVAGYTDSQDWRIEKRALSNGAVDSGFGTSGAVTVTAGFIAYGISIDSTYMYIAGYDDSSDWRIEKRALSDGAVDSGFGTSGVVTGAAASNISRSISIDGSYMYVVGDDSGGDWRIEKRALSNGAVDSGFGTSGVVTGASASVLAYTIATDGSYMYVAGNDSGGDWRIEKRALSNGAVDSGFGTSGVVTGASASDIAIAATIDSSYMYVAGEDVNDDWRIEKRALSDGALVDSDLADVGSALAAQDTAATLTSTGQAFRLRMDLHANTNKLKTSGQNFKLQVAKKGTGSCASPEFSYADVNDPASGTDGPNGTGTGADDNSIGTVSWSNPGNVTAEDGSDASAGQGTSHYLKATNFGFSIPSGSSVDGITVEVKKRADAGVGPVTDNAARIVKGGTIGSTDRSQGGNWPTSDTYATYGGSSDLWGESWSASDINASNFGFALSASVGTSSIANIDYVRVTVKYSAGSSSSTIRYNGSNNDGIALTDNANDPVHSGHTNNNQTYEEANNFTNSVSAVPAGQDGLWDFALVDDSAPGDTAYCFKAVDSGGSALNSYGVYPEITTFADTGPSTTADIVDAAGDPVASPSFAMNAHTLSFSCESVTGTFGASSQRIRVTNGLTAENWSLALAATSGATAVWSGGPTNYDFNDNSGSPAGCGDGADDDSLSGQISFDPSAGTLAPKSGCTNTGITKGSSGSFVEGTTDSLTILSGTTASDTDCYWDLTGADVSQQIPADQPTGSYSINLTLTLTAF
jgi:hypothetical protein